jgi:hypothetical protein
MTGEIHEDMDEFDDNRPCFFKLIFGGFNTEQLVILYPFALGSINLFLCLLFFWRVVLFVLEINNLLFNCSMICSERG